MILFACFRCLRLGVSLCLSLEQWSVGPVQFYLGKDSLYGVLIFTNDYTVQMITEPSPYSCCSSVASIQDLKIGDSWVRSCARPNFFSKDL